jgi:hypothetical protein
MFVLTEQIDCIFLLFLRCTRLIIITDVAQDGVFPEIALDAAAAF